MPSRGPPGCLSLGAAGRRRPASAAGGVVASALTGAEERFPAIIAPPGIAGLPAWTGALAAGLRNVSSGT